MKTDTVLILAAAAAALLILFMRRPAQAAAAAPARTGSVTVGPLRAGSPETVFGFANVDQWQDAWVDRPIAPESWN